MTDDNQNSVQRFSRRNRKNRLARPDLIFPPDEDENTSADESEPVQAGEDDAADEPLPASEYQAPVLDLDALDALGTDDEALSTLSNLSADEVRAPVIAPQAERYPPLNPDDGVADETPQPTAAELAAAKLKSRRQFRNNAITVFAILGIIGVISWSAMVWINPLSVVNPFPPQTPYVIVTATMGASDGNADMPTPNADGQIFIVATDAATPTLPPTDSPYPFIVPDAVLYAPNGNGLGCNWWSIAGTVTEADGTAIDGHRIQVTGDGFDESVFSGTIQAFGPGGFELSFVGTPQVAEFTVQLFSPQDAPLSQPITVTTRADCDANVAIVNFVQNR